MARLNSRQFEDYIPKKFCREFVEVKGHSGQLAMIMAVVCGIKPGMDDWVAIGRYEQYRKVCNRYGLIIRPDAVFKMVKGCDIPFQVIGSEHLTTTKAFGRMFNKEACEGEVHLFIARSKEHLERCFRNGWYPLIINNRIIDRPLVDFYKYGYDLGYPGCCVDFFQKYNNWHNYSYLYEALKNTGGCPHYLCNPFTKDVTYSYVYHMPCSYHCKATISLAGRLREAIYKEEPGFVNRIDECLKLPLLVFYERKFYAFKGRIVNNTLHYKEVYFIGRIPENNLYEADLKKGDSLFIENKDIVILRGGRVVKRIKWHRKSFAPEVPFIIQFS